MKTLVCGHCGKSFNRSDSAARQSEKRGHKPYCSLKCVGHSQTARLTKSGVVTEAFRTYNKVDEFSPFRCHIKSMKCHAKKINKSLEVSLVDLKEIWEDQGGICPYTGWLLVNQPSMNWRKQIPHTPDRASVDRIDSSLGYTRDNIRFVSVMIQYAKNSFSESELQKFCLAIKENFREQKQMV
jgi:hypothetical protein